MKRFIVLPLILLALTLHAQVEIPLWKGKAPNSIPNDTVKEESTFEGGITRVKMVQNPTMKFYLPPADKANGAAVIICPGGGYSILAIDHEGYQVAQRLNSMGVAAIVLKYRLPEDFLMTDKQIVPLMDAQQAIRYVRENASMFNIQPDKIGIMGFSAGGHLAATATTHFTEVVGGIKSKTSVRPDFSVLVYAVISFREFGHSWTRKRLIGDNPSEEQIAWYSNEEWVNENTPPTFLVHSTDDNAVPVKNSLRFFEQCVDHNVPTAMHIFEKGGHGYGMGRATGPESEWMPLLEDWLKTQKIIE